MLKAHYGIVKGNVKNSQEEKQRLSAVRMHFMIELLKTKSLCGKARLHLKFSKMLIAYSSACAHLLFNHFLQAFPGKNPKGGVLVKVESLHPLESSAVNNMISCSGNDNRAGNSSLLLCSYTCSRCRVTLTLNFNYILMECHIHESMKSTFNLCVFILNVLLFLDFSLKSSPYR